MPETNDLGDGAPHGYLGAVQDVEGPATLLEVGQQLMLPFLSMPGLVLTPGDTIPLRLLSVRLRRLVEAALAAPPPLARLLAVCITHSGDDQRSVLHDYHADVSHTVGCIAEVQQAGADGVLARGLQRCTVDLRFVSLEEHDSGRHVRATVLAEDMPAAGPAMGAQSPAFWPAAMWQRVDPQSLAATASQMCAEAMPQVRLPSARDPLGLSFWLNRNLPLDNRTRQRVLEQPSAAHRLIRQIALLRTMGGIFCLGCQGFAWACAYCSRCNNHLGWHFRRVAGQGQPLEFVGLRTSSAAAAAPPSSEAGSGSAPEDDGQGGGEGGQRHELGEHLRQALARQRALRMLLRQVSAQQRPPPAQPLP